MEFGEPHESANIRRRSTADRDRILFDPCRRVLEVIRRGDYPSHATVRGTRAASLDRTT
jgi:hypothetical protein